MRVVALFFSLIWLLACSEPAAVYNRTELILHQDLQVKVSISPAEAPVEQLLTWTLELAPGWTIEQAQVTGLSMNMGLIPLLFLQKQRITQGNQQVFQSEMVLGACSQPKMQWQLELKLHHVKDGQRQLLLPFYSSWP